jgi:hypothetical protein
MTKEDLLDFLELCSKLVLIGEDFGNCGSKEIKS